MNNKDRIAVQQLVIANAQAEIKELESWQGNRFNPDIGEEYWLVDCTGEPVKYAKSQLYEHEQMFNFFNCYEAEALAIKAAVMMNRSNAIIMACLQVDPDFVPDYLSGNQVHYSFDYKNSEIGCPAKWQWRASFIVDTGPCVSTEEKWHEAAALLTEWGIE
jgi:hypothetical protein